MSVRYDWYQTDEKIVITVMLKDAAKKNGKVSIEEEQVSVTADDYSLVLDLFDRINVERSTYRIVPVKVELTLAKSSGIRWSDLKRKENAESEQKAGIARIFRKDWDSVTKDIEKDTKNDEVSMAIYSDYMS